MKLTLTPLPAFDSKPGTRRYQFLYNGIKVQVEQSPQGTWQTWIDILQDGAIVLAGKSKEEAEGSLRKLLLQHFESLVTMLKHEESENDWYGRSEEVCGHASSTG